MDCSIVWNRGVIVLYRRRGRVGGWGWSPFPPKNICAKIFSSKVFLKIHRAYNITYVSSLIHLTLSLFTCLPLGFPEILHLIYCGHWGAYWDNLTRVVVSICNVQREGDSCTTQPGQTACWCVRQSKTLNYYSWTFQRSTFHLSMQKKCFSENVSMNVTQNV